MSGINSQIVIIDLYHSGCIINEDIRIRLKNLASRKASDLQCIKTEMLKWMRNEAHACIIDMFNDALQHGSTYNWTTNWIKPFHNGEDVNYVKN